MQAEHCTHNSKIKFFLKKELPEIKELETSTFLGTTFGRIMRGIWNETVQRR